MLTFLFFIAFIMTLVGVTKPSIVKMNSKKQALKIYGTITVVIMIAAVAFSTQSKEVKKAELQTKSVSQTVQNKASFSSDPAVKILQDWVVAECNSGSQFDHNKLYNKLGSYELISVSNSNPEIIKAFYYPNADMTIIANVKTHKIVTWKLGRQTS